MFRLLAILALLAATAFPQGERATITGTVTDTSQAIIPGTRVTLRNTGTNIVTLGVSNAAGIYVFPALTPGSYDVTFEKDGFRTRKVSGIPLSTSLTATINAVMEVGTVTEAVQVQASAVQLETQTSGLSGTVETRRVVELPLLGRNPLQLASLAPGVIPTSAQGGNGSGAIGSATNSRISGGLAMQNAVLMDGGESRGFTSGGQSYSVPLESVAEFKVETASYSSEFGHSGGGVRQCVNEERNEQLPRRGVRVSAERPPQRQQLDQQPEPRKTRPLHPQRVWRRGGRPDRSRQDVFFREL